MDTLAELCHKCRWMLLNPRPDVDETTRGFLQSAANDLEVTLRALELRGRPLIVFCGRTNVGKSTLMNALLGGKIAPVSNGDWSSRPVEYRHAEDEMIFLADSYPPRKIPFHSAEELSAALQKLSTRADPANAFGKNQLVVNLNVPVLQNELILCDMPGFLATTGEEGDTGLHDDDIRQYLERQKNRVRTYLVSNAQVPDDSVIQFIRENLPTNHLCLVINYRKSDHIEERKSTLESVWRQQLNRPLDILYINAKAAIAGSEERDALVEHIARYGTEEGRRENARRDLVRFFRDTGMYLRGFAHCESAAEVLQRQALWVVSGLLEAPEFAEMKAVFDEYWAS